MNNLQEASGKTISRNLIKTTGIVAMFAVFTSGCSAFQSSRAIDPSPFADNTNIMFGDAITVSRSFQFRYLKGYTVPEHDDIAAAGVPLKRSLTSIVYYSNQVIAIYNSNLSDQRKNAEIASYISAALKDARANIDDSTFRLDDSDIQATLNNIRSAETFLDGLGAAGPIIHAVATAVNQRIDAIQDLVPVVVKGYERELEREFGTTRANFNNLTRLRDDLMLSMNRLYQARVGDPSQLDEALAENESLRQYIADGRNSSPAQIASAEQFLLGQLNDIDTLLHQMDDTKAEYLAKRLELTEWQTHVDKRLMIARNAIAVWGQSHRNLGAGIAVPPLIDLPELAAELVSSAL